MTSEGGSREFKRSSSFNFCADRREDDRIEACDGAGDVFRPLRGLTGGLPSSELNAKRSRGSSDSGRDDGTSWCTRFLLLPDVGPAMWNSGGVA